MLSLENAQLLLGGMTFAFTFLLGLAKLCRPASPEYCILGKPLCHVGGKTAC